MNDIFDASVLFVDDEPDILEILVDCMKGEVRNIYSTPNWEEALQLVQSKPIDLVVLDLKMPGKDGVSLLEDLRILRPDLGAIFLTAHGDKNSVQAALRLGAYDFIDKPFQVQLMKVYIHRALEKIYYERILKEVLELFIYHYSQLELSKFQQMSVAERDVALKAALGVARMKIMKKELEPAEPKGGRNAR